MDEKKCVVGQKVKHEERKEEWRILLLLLLLLFGGSKYCLTLF